jgi:hypothetical protein
MRFAFGCHVSGFRQILLEFELHPQGEAQLSMGDEAAVVEDFSEWRPKKLLVLPDGTSFAESRRNEDGLRLHPISNLPFIFRPDPLLRSCTWR